MPRAAEAFHQLIGATTDLQSRLVAIEEYLSRVDHKRVPNRVPNSADLISANQTRLRLPKPTWPQQEPFPANS
jgi:hypothetical protein